MATTNLDEEIRALLDRWNRSILDKDVATAAELREDGYTATMPDGVVLTKEAELALVASPAHTIESIRTQRVEVRGRGEDEATAVFDYSLEGEYLGERIDALYKYTLSLRRTGGRWRARSSSLVIEKLSDHGANGDAAAAAPPHRGREKSAAAAGASFSLRKLVPRAIKTWIKGQLGGLGAAGAPSSSEPPFLPYKPGLSFVIPKNTATAGDDSRLPIPPEELWLGYNYPAHGEAHVRKMLEIARDSGFSFEKGDRVLDFGCGAGRMIRHLKDLAGTCEIWGTDISAEHVYWCKQHLSPPFNFATTTKVPHLPFEDRSFRFIYCGSVFTHIDDLADAWLLELRRVLAPGGRLYLTIHDEHTVELFESGRYDSTDLIRRLRTDETYYEAKESFGMLTVGRGNDAQVFYDADYFSKMLRPTFDILSVKREAYFYQTAFLLKRK
jgi:SAM-dependent methyltransferase